MVAIDIITPEYDAQRGEFGERVRARLVVDERELNIEGDEDYGHFESVTVLHPQTSRELRFPDDGEEWARYLPTAFRGGQLFARVVQDTANRSAAVGDAEPAQR